MRTNNLTRLAVLVATILLLAAPVYGQTSFYFEAPMLAARTAVGDLPPVDERLPNNPLVVTPHESIGVYGGTWHMAMVQQDTVMPHRTIGYENLLRWDPTWRRHMPNVAQSVESNMDSTVFTIRLREGMRWSDGHPFTSADILFWYQAVYQNDTISDALGDVRTVGENLSVTAQDEFTLIFQFTQPNGLFLQRLASSVGGRVTYMPRHYLEQYHPDYNSDLDRLVAEAGAASWLDLFRAKSGFLSSEMPTLNAWVVWESFDSGVNFNATVRAVRNPYYWKVDTAFNQLPYIDAVEYQVVQSRDDLMPLVLAGAIDMQDRNIPLAATLSQNLAAGAYDLYRLVTSYSNYMAVSFNQTHPDPVKRQIFQNRDFRIAMSHAIDRSAIIEAVGLTARPMQVAPLEGTPFYQEQMATQYLEYDPDLANAHLDRAGYSMRDSENFRLGPDGERISFTVLYPNPVPTGNYDIHLDRIQMDWRAVGIEMQIEVVARDEAEIRWQDNAFDATVWVGEGGFDSILAPRYYVPTDAVWSHQGPLWARWYLNAEDPTAEEPPASVRDAITLYRRILQTTDLVQQEDYMKQIIAIAAEEFYVIGIHEMPVSYGIVRRNFRNVPEVMFLATNYLNPAPTNPCQYYILPDGGG